MEGQVYIKNAMSLTCRKKCKMFSIRKSHALWDQLQKIYNPTYNKEGRSDLMQKFWKSHQNKNELVADYIQTILDIGDGIEPSTKLTAILDCMLIRYLYNSVDKKFDIRLRSLRENQDRTLDSILKAFEVDDEAFLARDAVKNEFHTLPISNQAGHGFITERGRGRSHNSSTNKSLQFQHQREKSNYRGNSTFKRSKGP